MTDDDDITACHTIHRTLAGHVLHAVNLGYDEVAVTYLRRCDDAMWEAEIVLEALEVAYVMRHECPLEAALGAATEVAELLEATAERAGATVN